MSTISNWRYYDYTALAHLEEFYAFARAMDALVHKLNAEADLTQPAFEALLVDLARNLLASQDCEYCESEEPVIPCAARQGDSNHDGDLEAGHICPSCGASSQAWFASRDVLVRLFG